MNMARLYAGLSFDEAVQKYAKTVYTACVMRLSGNAEVDDCVQNTFVKLFQKSPDFHDENHLKAWLLRVAINQSRNAQRLSRRVVSLETLNSPPPISVKRYSRRGYQRYELGADAADPEIPRGAVPTLL